MMRADKITALGLAAVLAFGVGHVASGQTAGDTGQKAYRARLAPVPIDAAMMAAIAGSGSVTATLTGSKLSVSGTFEGLRSPATVARIHRGPKGVRGPAVFDLKVAPGADPTSGTITGAFDLNKTQVDDLGLGRFYVQLHSEKASEGNLWGWLLLQESKR
jgi:CHRD domain